MARLIYVLQFKGQAGPVEGAEGVLRAGTSASPCRITTQIGADGVSGQIEAIEGTSASFESEVTFISETTFLESGTIRFGDGASLTFSTVGSGYIAPSAEEGIAHGAVSWRIDSGEGQLAGATGLITSNFLVGSAGEVTDNHFGLIFLA